MTARPDETLAKRCPHCGSGLRTKDSRPSHVPDVLCRRRLQCTGCGARFTTHEIIVDDLTTVGAAMITVAAHDRAVEAIGELIAHLDASDVAQVRRSLGQIRRKGEAK